MAWTDLTFVECSILTASRMNALQGNFAALAGGAAGAPRPAIDDVSSLATVHAASGFVAPEASSFGTVHAASGFAAAEASSFGTVEVGSNAGFCGGLRFPHFALLFTPGNPPSIERQTNVSCLQRVAAGDYIVHVSPAFASSDYYLMGFASGTAGSQGNPSRLVDSSGLSRVALRIRTPAGAVSDAGQRVTVIGFGD